MTHFHPQATLGCVVGAAFRSGVIVQGSRSAPDGGCNCSAFWTSGIAGKARGLPSAAPIQICCEPGEAIRELPDAALGYG
jgi:hypothetical protein